MRTKSIGGPFAAAIACMTMVACGSSDVSPTDQGPGGASGSGGVAGGDASGDVASGDGSKDGPAGEASSDAKSEMPAEASTDANADVADPPDATEAATGCGTYAGKQFFNCAPDGMGRGKCVNGSLVFETCSRGCLIEPNGQDDVCLGTTNTWSCTGSYGKSKLEDGDYYATSFGCWTDANSNVHTDPGDNCIPGCLSKAQSDGLCENMSGPECEESTNWYAADAGRFGCMARLYVENPKNGKAVVVVALDYGPACWVENGVSHGIIDLSGRVNQYLFGGDQGASDKTLVHVVEVAPSAPLGPV